MTMIVNYKSPQRHCLGTVNKLCVGCPAVEEGDGGGGGG